MTEQDKIDEIAIYYDKLMAKLFAIRFICAEETDIQEQVIAFENDFIRGVFSLEYWRCGEDLNQFNNTYNKLIELINIIIRWIDGNGNYKIRDLFSNLEEIKPNR